VLVASGAQTAGGNVPSGNAGCDQLIHAELPEVKMVFLQPIGPVVPWNLLTEVDKFSTAGPKGRTDGSVAIVGATAKSVGHHLDSFIDDVGHAAAPT